MSDLAGDVAFVIYSVAHQPLSDNSVVIFKHGNNDGTTSQSHNSKSILIITETLLSTIFVHKTLWETRPCVGTAHKGWSRSCPAAREENLLSISAAENNLEAESTAGCFHFAVLLRGIC